ncbi:MAG: hypothetical protein EA420_03385 [Candidatus Competibacteraceae bacterium]|nr:MAG: hypothetical protein EA420_03385 [Candidatus Competibacteraceae bacterium]
MNDLRRAAILAVIDANDWTELSDFDAAAAGYATTTVHERVPKGVLFQELDNFVHASGAPVWEAIEASVALTGEAEPVAIACRAAVRLRDAGPDYPPVNVQSPMLQTQLTILVAGGILTQAQADLLAALGDREVTIWEAGDVSLPVWERDVKEARNGD